ncbi:MAG: outer membrane protein assembly factor BamB [Pseudomonadota bacterium]
MNVLRTTAVFFMAALLGGCAIFGGDDETVDPPMELADFEAGVDVKRVMSAGLGDSGERLRLALRPVGDGTRVYAANAKGEISAFDGDSGKRVWRTNIKAALTAGPGVGDGRVVVAETNGTVVALDARSGDEIWRSDIAAEVLAPPVLGGERVFVRTVDGRLLALRGSDGEQLWFVEQPVPALSQRGVGAPVISGDSVVAGFDNGRIVSANLISGEVTWELPLGIASGRSDIERMVDADGAIAAVGNDLYLSGFQSRTAAVAAESGQALWARELSSYAGLGVDWANVYLTLDDDRVVALTRNNGAQEWSHELLLRRQLTAPITFGEYVVVGDFEGYLHFINARTGTLAGRVRLSKAPIVNRPYVMADKVYAQAVDGAMAGYQIRTIERN